MSNEENINYEEEINNINKKINEIINNILDGHSFKWLTTKEYSDLDDESKNNSNIEYHILDSELIILSDNGKKYKVKVSDEGALYTEEIIDIIKVENLVLNSESVILNEGEIYQLEVTVVPDNATNKKVVWESSDSNIVSVNEGKLVAISLGEAIITVSSSDGLIKKECKITVKNMVVDDGLVCYADIIDFSNNILIDKTGRVVFTTVGSPKIVDKYLEFDGIDDMIYSSSITELTSNCTISIVFNEEVLGKYSVESNKQCKVMWNGKDFRGYGGVCVFTEKNSSTKYNVRCGRTTISPPKVYYSDEIGTDNKFTNVDILFNLDEDKYSVYKNSSLIGSASLEGNLANNNFIVLGGIFTTLPYSFSYSNIGSIKIYNRVLNESEIIRNYEYEKTIRG